MKIRFGFCPGAAVSACKGSAEAAQTDPAAANECWTNSLLVLSTGLSLGSCLICIPNPFSWAAITHLTNRRAPAAQKDLPRRLARRGSDDHRHQFVKRVACLHPAEVLAFSVPELRQGYQRCLSGLAKQNFHRSRFRFIRSSSRPSPDGGRTTATANSMAGFSRAAVAAAASLLGQAILRKYIRPKAQELGVE